MVEQTEKYNGIETRGFEKADESTTYHPTTFPITSPLTKHHD